MKSLFSFLTTLFLFGTHLFAQTPLPYNSIKKVEGKAAVVSAHPLASEAGLKMLQQGGNAIDAAIATQLALAVVYPGAGNLGGGGFLLAKLSDGQHIAIDYRETAPEKAFKDMGHSVIINAEKPRKGAVSDEVIAIIDFLSFPC
jgi:gamma-glutamyltranspeptidase/glutathione hydrolase